MHWRPIGPLASEIPLSRGARALANGESDCPTTTSDQRRTWTDTTHRLDALAALDRPGVADLGVAPRERAAAGKSNEGEDGESVVYEHSARMRRAVARKERIGSSLGEEGKKLEGDSTTGRLYMSALDSNHRVWRPGRSLEPGAKTCWHASMALGADQHIVRNAI